jgi:hypothetical protein
MSLSKRLAFMLVCLLQLADLVSTRSAMMLHVNPLMRSADGHADLLKALLVKVMVCVLAYFIIRWTPRLRMVWVICAGYGGYLLSNWLLLP